MNISQLYLICGFLGADKTTFSKELARETDAQYFNTDEWVAKLFPQSEYENNREQWFEIATNTIWNELKLCTTNGHNAILDAGFWTHAERDNAFIGGICCTTKSLIWPTTCLRTNPPRNLMYVTIVTQAHICPPAI